MTDEKLMSLAFKIIGVQCAIQIIEYLGQGWMLAFPGDGMSFGSRYLLILAGVTPPILLLLTSYILIRYSDLFAARLYPNATKISGNDGWDESKWYYIGFSLLGVWLLVWTIPPNLVQILLNFNLSLHPVTGVAMEARQGAWNLLLKTVLQILFGLYLILGSSHLYKVIRRWRREEGSPI